MRRNKYVKVFEAPIPTWALCYLINNDDSALTPEDKKEVDAWVERKREGGRIDVCCPKEGDYEYFCRYPAFGLPCYVEDCNVVVDHGPRYPRCYKPCLGQSRFEPLKRTALDGKTWWCIFDHRKSIVNPVTPIGWLGNGRWKTRKGCILHIWQEMVHGRLPFVPDDDRHDIEWLEKEGLTCGNSR
jgi:hypothetical protein